MKYQPIYLPYTEDEDKFKEEPLFDTEDEAWDYIQKTHCQCESPCNFNGDGEKLDYCESCEVEWSIDYIK